MRGIFAEIAGRSIADVLMAKGGVDPAVANEKYGKAMFMDSDLRNATVHTLDGFLLAAELRLNLITEEDLQLTRDDS